MDMTGADFQQFKARIAGELDGASAAVERGDLAAAEERLHEALRTVRESAGPGDAAHDGTGKNFHDGTGPI